MKKLKNGLVLFLLITVMLFSTACQQTKSGKSVGLTVSAAASLKDAMTEIQALYKQEKPNTTIAFNFGSSGALQQQIEQGANVDLFISAANKQMKALKDNGLLMEATTKTLLGNQLVLVVPKDSTIPLTRFADVAKTDVKKLAMGEPKTVPAGKYAEEVFTKLNIMDTVKSKTVYAKDVKEVLNWVETGNADAGVVYTSDAKSSDKVKVIATAADDTHSPIVYPVSVLKASKNADAAKDFLAFLSSDKAKTVFEKYGFIFLAK